MAALLVCCGFSFVLAAGDGPVIPRGQGDSCVAPTELMRRNHMDYLDHQRDETVIDGQRSGKFSLVDCVNCHAQKDDSGAPVRIDAVGQFCQTCHAYAAVKIDCFSCHAALPDQAFEKEPKWHGHPDRDLARTPGLEVQATQVRP